MSVYDTWYKEVDGWLIHYCEVCNAEITAQTSQDLRTELDKHKLFVACSSGY